MASPVAYAFVNGVRCRDWLKYVAVHQEGSSHEYVSVSVQTSVLPTKTLGGSSAGLADSVTWADGDLVELTYGWGTTVSSFYGYVAGHELDASPATWAGAVRLTTVNYSLIGTSMPMQSQKTVAWPSSTPSFIARSIAKANGLRPVVHRNVSVLDRVQAGVSDFRYLSDLADQTGFLFYVLGGSLYFLDPRQVFGDATHQTITTLLHTDAPGKRGNVHSFRVSSGESNPDGGLLTNKVINFPLKNGAVVPLTAKNTRTDTGATAWRTLIVDSPRTPTNYVEARDLLAGSDLRSLNWVLAEVEIDGSPSVHPGSLTSLQGDGIPLPNQGNWLVKGAVHELTLSPNAEKSIYRTNLVLGRDQNESAAVIGSAPGSRTGSPVPLVVVNGRWRAQNFGGTSRDV